MTKWLSRFLIFLLVVVVALSIGLSIYYFTIKKEVFSFEDKDGTGLVKYVNVGETIDVAVIRKNASTAEYSLKSTDEKIVKFKEDVKEDVFRFETLKGGQAEIVLETTNSDYNQKLSLTIYVGDGSESSPLYVRNYNDLKSIGSQTMPLDAWYSQTADIDMDIDTANWAPIAYGNENGFTGVYNGNGYKIMNLKMVQVAEQANQPNTTGQPAQDPEGDEQQAQDPAPAADAGEQQTAVVYTVAGMFDTVGLGGVVKNLNIVNPTITGNYEYVGSVAAKNRGTIRQLTVTGAQIKSTRETPAYVGGVVGINNGDKGGIFLYSVEYSSFDGAIEGGTYVGGIAGDNRAALITNTYSVGSIKNTLGKSYIGGIAGVNNGIRVNSGANEKILKANVVNNYSIMTFDVVTPRVGGILGINSNYNSDKSDVTNMISGPIVLRYTNDTDKNYNRVYGNYYLAKDGLKGIAGLNDSDAAYLVMSAIQGDLMKSPNAIAVNEMNEKETSAELDEVYNPELLYVSYNQNGKYMIWDFANVWTINRNVNNGYPSIRSDAVITNDGLYDGAPVVKQEEPIDDPVVDPEPVNPDPVNPDPVNPDPVNPDPVNPDPVNPDPVNPDPVNPDPVNPDPVEPEPVFDQNALAKLFADDLADDGVYNGTYNIAEDVVITSPWTPVGTKEHPFSGKFNMNGHSIKNLVINQEITEITPTTTADPAEEYFGFFGYVLNADISGLTIDGIIMNLDKQKSGLVTAGAIAGWSDNSRISNCYVVNAYIDEENKAVPNCITVTQQDKESHIGGLVGFFNGGSIRDSGARIAIIADNFGTDGNAKVNIGGIVGKSVRGYINDCYYSPCVIVADKVSTSYEGMSWIERQIARVSNAIRNSILVRTQLYGINANVAAGSRVGGVIGYSQGTSVMSANTLLVVNITAGDKDSQTAYAGGLVGYIDVIGNERTLIRRSKAESSIKVTGLSYVGGLSGYATSITSAHSDSALTNDTILDECYAKGTLVGKYVGGLVGYLKRGVVNDCMTECSLSGSGMAGYAYVIDFANKNSWGKVRHCFSNCNFTTSEGTAYWESSSAIRQHGIDSDERHSGYVENCVYNKSKDNSGSINSQYDSNNFLWWNIGTREFGDRSEEDCKKATTFTDRGFNTTWWALADGSMPSLKNIPTKTLLQLS